MKIYSHIKTSFILLLPLFFIQCKKTNWYENYREKEKSPFGTYIVYNELENLFKKQEIKFLDKNIYDFLVDDSMWENTPHNYICIKNNVNKLNNIGIEKLLEFVYKGNYAFIAVNNFNENLEKQLEITTQNLDQDAYTTTQLKKLQGNLSYNNPEFNNKTYFLNRNLRKHYFTSYNVNKTVVLGTQKILNKEKPVFIKIYHGNGAFYLHTQPIAFTNYYLLSNNYSYTEKAFSYLPNGKILWDPQLKYSHYGYNENEEDTASIFSFFKQHPSLKLSLYVFFIGLLFFMVFNARRKQRAIPIIVPPKNSTIEFTHTIANLYFKEKNHKNLVTKKINYFLQKVREKYILNTQNLNDDFIKKLAQKTNNTIEDTQNLITIIKELQQKTECTIEELTKLNLLIEHFFENQ